MNVTDHPQPHAEDFSVPRFRVEVSGGEDATLVVPRGELDIASSRDLAAVLVAQSGWVVVDLRELTFVDASGLRVLLDAEARSRQDGGQLRFVPAPVVRRLIEAAGLPDELTYVERTVS